MTTETPGAPKRGEALREVAEDAIGFGAAELRLTRDLLRRPRAVMDVYDAHGSTAGGLYPRPLRYWATINGLYLLLTALAGGLERSLQVSQSGATREDLEWLAGRAGKTVEEFSADLEQWMSLVMLPLYALIFGGALFLLFRKWSPADDRQDFNQTFTFLNAWTLWTLPFGLVSMFLLSNDLMMLLSVAVMFLSIPIVYAVFGRGRWWRTRTGAVAKGAVLVLVSFLAFVPLSILAGGLSLAGAFFLP
ncbi:MAG TPA: hypothetical protein VF699_13475 [Caulobacteraceae bacterium]